MRSLVLIAACLVAASAWAQQAPVRSITATGVAERKITPDEAHVNVNVGVTNPKLELAKTEHDKKLRDVLAIAKANGIEAAQVKTLNSMTQPHYVWENNKQNLKGYRVQTQLDITVKKTETLGDLLQKLNSAGLENGGAQEWGGLINVNYTIANPDKIRDEMLADAVKNARAKAQNMATAAGASVGEAIQINEGNAPQFNFPTPMPMMARAMKASADAAAPEMAPPAGEQTLNANVTVTFELK
jgi:uncharacterized protein YggE